MSTQVVVLKLADVGQLADCVVWWTCLRTITGVGQRQEMMNGEEKERREEQRLREVMSASTLLMAICRKSGLP